MEAHSSSEKFSNIPAEKAILGFLLINNNNYEQISDVIKTDYFFLDMHAKIFEIMIKLFNKSQVADVITISNLASYTPAYKDITFDYLIELTNSVVSTSSSKDYALLIHDLYLKRQIIEIQNNINTYLSSGDNSLEQIEKLEKDIFSLSEKGLGAEDVQTFEASLEKALTSVELARSFKNGISGITTGLKDFDKKTGGLQRSDLIILAGRPPMGKTALATNIAYNAARCFLEQQGHPGAPVLIFSLEMSSEQIAARILSSEIGVSSDVLRKGTIDDAGFNRLASAVSTLKHTPLFIDDTPSITVGQIRAKCRRVKRKNGLGLVVIDYIQLIGNERYSNNRTTEVSEITRGLKGIAKELDIPIIALSQLSRGVESRDDKKPMLSDLRESGSIEQDADLVAFIFREEYYLEKAEPTMQRDGETEDKFKARYEMWKQNYERSKNKATVILAKNRHGAIGNVDLYFDAARTKFGDLDKMH